MLLELVTGLMLAVAPDGAATPTPQPAKPEPKKVCRKDIETGSLIKGKKICYTPKQWQQISDANRTEVERMQSSGSQSGN